MGVISLIFSLLSLAIQIQLFPGEAKQIEIRNSCSFTVWPASSLSSLSHSSLKNHEALVVDLPTAEYGRLWVWGRTGCHNSTGKFACQTGDCGSGLIDCAGVPTRGLNATTLVEFNFINGGGFYDVSLVNGYNVLVSVETGSLSDVAGCVFDVSGACLKQLKLGGACRSACNVFNTPKYCCTGGGTLCGPTENSRIFMEACPRAYSYLLDVANSTRSGKYPRYVVTFCPSSASVISQFKNWSYIRRFKLLANSFQVNGEGFFKTSGSAHHQLSGLMPINLPARLQLRLSDWPGRCAPISRLLKMSLEIAQGVHFQIITDKSV